MRIILPKEVFLQFCSQISYLQFNLGNLLEAVKHLELFLLGTRYLLSLIYQVIPRLFVSALCLLDELLEIHTQSLVFLRIAHQTRHVQLIFLELL